MSTESTTKNSAESFEALVSGPDDTLDLARIGLAISMGSNDPARSSAYLGRLDEFAKSAREKVTEGASLWERLEAMDKVLFEEEGFRGNADDYFDAKNSFLDEVLDRRIGIPITLCVIYLEVGWRLGLPIGPVSFPSHFMVATTAQERQFIDPFNRGARLDPAELLSRLVPLLGTPERARTYFPHATAIASRREVVARMLRNLKGIYARENNLNELLSVSNRMIALNPNDASAVRDRGHVLVALECHQAAYFDYDHYLRLAPNSEDASDIRDRMEQLRPIATRLN